MDLFDQFFSIFTHLVRLISEVSGCSGSDFIERSGNTSALHYFGELLPLQALLSLLHMHLEKFPVPLESQLLKPLNFLLFPQHRSF